MKTNNVRTVLVAFLVVAAMLVYTLRSPGGSLDPQGPPQPTMRTLDEIYEAVDSATCGGLTISERQKVEHLWVGPNPGPFLRLQVDGNDIEGESTIMTMDRESTIECVGFDYELITPREQTTGDLTGRRQHGPVTVLKPVDKSTPLLYKALCNNEPVNTAEFRFFRPSAGGSGAEEHIYTVLLENGYISSIKSIGRNMEEVSFVFQDITWTYEIGGATHKDSWKGES